LIFISARKSALLLTRLAWRKAAETEFAELPFSTTKRISWEFNGFLSEQELAVKAVASRMSKSSPGLDFFKI
jgi:hypothetical protein